MLCEIDHKKPRAKMATNETYSYSFTACTTPAVTFLRMLSVRSYTICMVDSTFSVVVGCSVFCGQRYLAFTYSFREKDANMKNMKKSRETCCDVSTFDLIIVVINLYKIFVVIKFV